MIQRKQTIWLFLSILCMIATVYIPFGYHTINNDANTQALSTNALKANYNFILIILISINIAHSGFAIFLFKKRNIQKLLCLLGLLDAVVIAIYEFFIANNIAQNFVISFGIALPVVSAILFLLAWFGINADEKLVKSIDRLRD